METNKTISIIGAGPAGLSAAIQLAEYGIKSTIYDENPKIGGAIFKQPEKGLKNHPLKDETTFIKAKKLFDQFENHKSDITLSMNTEVLGVFPLTNEIGIAQDGVFRKISDTSLIVSTGCYERAQPFPGWTLPGIMSVGGLQLQVKCGTVKPGHKAALIGTGPLLLVAAKQLHMSGVDVVAVVEAGKRKQLVSKAFNMIANKSLLKEGVDYVNYLKKHNIPMYYGHGVVSASGDGQVQKVVVAPVDDKWYPNKEKSFELEVDCIGIQYGYVPRIQFTDLLQCENSFDKHLGGSFPQVDKWQRTTIEGVYSAGDNSGVYGADVAMLEGRLAALGYLIDTRVITESEATQIAAPLIKEAQRYKKFQHSFHDFSGLKEGLLSLPEEDTIICRCENIKRSEIDRAIEAGVEEMPDLKINTRVGMGDCQGKMCGSFCREYLAHKNHKKEEDVMGLKPRFPLAPIAFESIVDNQEF
ncbi:NAD(P)/FAD-dependent oxidoreductase [Aureivirga marina]|uniref:NAD(P)/FAD-dependent oxidoreductase n=1 Tax=Aureivirga marina TaxID=1182451 RepID=UPI0018CB80E1|nr:NAD(P)/FAD-dependent oxidoreductase [Aureivirga marina]